MVLSVFAMTVSFAGTAAAQEPAQAVEYSQGTIEVVLDNPVPSGETINNSNVTVMSAGSTLSITSASVGTDRKRIEIVTPTDIRPIDEANVTFTGNVTGSVDIQATGATADLVSGVTPSRVYAGTSVAVVTSDTDSPIDILKDGTRLTTRGTGANSSVYVYDSSGAEVGAFYNFVDQNGVDNQSITFADLDLSISAPAEVTTTEQFTATAGANDIERDIEFRLVNSEGTTVSRNVTGLGANGEATGFLNITTLDATGDYTVVATDADSGVSATSDTVTASTPVIGDVSLASTIMTDQRGDVIPISLAFEGDATTASIVLGSSEVNFNVTFTVTDVDEDGEATVLFNTASSNSINSPSSPGSGLRPIGDDTVTVTAVADNVTNPVEPAEYPVVVSSGGDETAVGTVIVEERSTSGMTIHTAPRGSISGTSELSDVMDLITAEDQAVATSDIVVVEVQASGLYGYIDDEGDLFPGTNGVSLSIVEDPDTVENNEEAIQFNVTSGNSNLFTDAANDRFFLTFSEGALGAEVENDDRFDVTFSIADTSNVSDVTESNSSSFSVVGGDVTIDVGGQNLVLPAEENATVTGTSTFAPGTEVNVRLRSIGGQSPFTLDAQPAPTVNADGTWSATFNLSGKSDGQQFTASATSHGETADATGEIGEITATVSFSNQQAQDGGSLVVVDSTRLSQGGFLAIHQGSASGDVVGWSDYLESGPHQNIQIRLTAGNSVTGTQTLVAMPHKDTDGDRTYDFVASGGADDGPYFDGNAPVVDDAQVSLQAATATVTPTATPTATPTPTPTPDEGTPTATPDTGDGDGDGDGDGIPGFGAGIAVLALLGAALLAARRRS